MIFLLLAVSEFDLPFCCTAKLREFIVLTAVFSLYFQIYTDNIRFLLVLAVTVVFIVNI